MRENAAKAFDGRVEIRRFVDREATRGNFFDGLQWLKKGMKTQDVGIIFFSGHGHRDEDGIFYMLPSEVNRKRIDATAVDGALFEASLPGSRGDSW